MKALEGILAAITTPFDDQEALALDALEANLKRWLEGPLHGYVVLGTTGEFVSLTTEEKRACLERARAVIPRDKLMLAGTGCESTRETIELTRWAAKLGADFAIVVTPHYYRWSLRPESMVDHYRAVAEASEIPIVLYNIPASTGLTLGQEQVTSLAEHPNIAGIKDSSGDVFAVQEYDRATPDSFRVLTGAAQVLAASLVVGCSGAILAEACVAPELTVDLWEAHRRGDLRRARERQSRLTPLNRKMIGEQGIPGVKSAMDHMGFHGGRPRRPLESLDEEATSELARLLESLDILTIPKP